MFVRFLVLTDPVLLLPLFRQYKTRHLFYLQLRREILCGYMFCPDEAATALGSLALQAEFGDYVERYHGKCYFETEHYLPGRVCQFEMIF